MKFKGGLFTLIAIALILSDCGKSPEEMLFTSASNDDIPEANRLIQKGVSVNSRNSSGSTPLHAATSTNMALLLIENEADVNAIDNAGVSPLHSATRRADGHLVSLFLERGADPNVSGSGGMPLFDAPNGQIALSLIEHGADVNANDANGFTPLHSAAAGGRLDVARLLIERGAQINVAEKIGGNTPLHFSMGLIHPDMAMLLLEHHAVIDAVNSAGLTPLHYAAKRGMLYTSRVLLLHGANPLIETPLGDRPLDLAAASGNHRVEEMLRQAALTYPLALNANASTDGHISPQLRDVLDTIKIRRNSQLRLDEEPTVRSHQ